MTDSRSTEVSKLVELLPGFHCGACGYDRCDDFAEALVRGEAKLDDCPYLQTERFAEERRRLEKLLEEIGEAEGARPSITGVLDGYEADLVLSPLPDEPACREILHPFWSEADIEEGDVIRYRPWGCPTTHFARVLDAEKGLLTVHIVGPRHRLGETDFEYKDVGLCLVVGFEGIVSEGRVPNVGETVRFVPEHCMMQKVHSGVVIEAVGDRLRIECIDLKVWAPPK
ncbi:TPA: hypothetical protein HA336_01845 [Methanopyrus kandleri]|uniref:Predicted Fe-S protein n=2 Tax=Methanopyrus kandleri TaxID=2320 RepID=Q8TX65_METKA|nr:Predicted Fe-S protein [Methanopyrus kandleri AV19]HII69961.1 hypothetical protein [Methanopyrus kandleri]